LVVAASFISTVEALGGMHQDRKTAISDRKAHSALVHHKYAESVFTAAPPVQVMDVTDPFEVGASR
jgi:hypothetical protein